MNKLLTIALTLLASTWSFSALSAEMMTKSEFKKVHNQYIEIGNISTSGESDTATAKENLSKKADKIGGDIYILTSGNTNNKIHGTAKVYKKK